MFTNVCGTLDNIAVVSLQVLENYCFICVLSCYLKIMFVFLKVRRTIAEIMDLCYSFGELVQGIGKEKFLLSAEREDTLGHISKVCN